MGQIAALMSRDGEDVSSKLGRTLENASQCRGDAFGVATKTGARVSHGMPKMPISDLMMGHKLTKIHPEDPAQPLSQHGYSMATEGRNWSIGESSDATFVADMFGREPRQGAECLYRENASFAFTVLEEAMLICGRDEVGHVPMYIGENDELIAVASNRKMIWSVGLEAKRFKPGYLAEITRQGTSLSVITNIAQPPEASISLSDAVERLDELLSHAVEARCRGVFRVALGFSGGIDSSLLAYYLDDAGVQVDLVCVGMQGSRGFEAAESAADHLDLPLRLEAFDVEDVEEDLDDVLWSVEEPDPMKVGVGLPMYWAAKGASEAGTSVFLSGNGSDELFGGYRKYAMEYADTGDAVRASMFRDVVSAHEVNYERDYKICSDLGMELRLPFADIEVIRFGLSLPTGLKLSRTPDAPRKLILRALARKIGFTEEMADRPKKAVQYSTEVNKALTKMAKSEGKKPRDFLAERFERVKKERLSEAT